ncbi:MAG: C1 family peptidase [Actinomycetota bacterium]
MPSTVTGPFERATLDTFPDDVPAVVAELVARRSVVVVMRVTDRFISAPGGLVTDGGAGAEAHAVVAVGAARYVGEDTIPGIERQSTLLCVRNSWGVGWGVEGHALMTADAIDNCFITAFTIAPT